MDDDFNYDTMVPEEPSKNRTFWIFLIGLLGIVIISIIGILLWVNLFSPRQQQARNAQATQTAAALTEMAVAQIPTSTFTQWPSNTPEPTATLAPTRTIAPPAQATTLVPTVQSSLTPIPTALPNTGFAEETDLPVLMALGVAFVLATIIVRQIRVRISN